MTSLSSLLLTRRQVSSIGTVTAYSANKYSALVAYKIMELFQY